MMIEALKAFLAVVDTGNLSTAARALELAVSSVSRKIDWLEADLGTRLLHRSSRAVMLTDAGEQFAPRARAILAELAEARSAMSALDTSPRGPLTVTVPASFGRRHVAPAVTGFLRRYPLIELDLNVSDDIVDLAARRVDVAVRISVLPDSDLLATLLAPQRRYVCASPDYVARHGAPATPADLLAHNCLTFSTRTTPPYWWCFNGVNRNRPLPVRGTMRTDDIDAMLQAAIGGVGLVHFASWLVADAVAAGQLVPVLGPEHHPRRQAQPAIHAVRLPGRSHAVKAQLFINYLREIIGPEPYWEKTMQQALSPFSVDASVLP